MMGQHIDDSDLPRFSRERAYAVAFFMPPWLHEIIIPLRVRLEGRDVQEPPLRTMKLKEACFR